MASELRVTTIANNAGTESVGSTYVINGSAKVWGFLNWSSSLSADGSLNVSSVSDDGNGDFGVNFTSSMADSNYAYNTLSSLSAGNTYVYGWELVKATGSANLQCGRHYDGGSTVAEDPQTNELSVHGDLA